MKRERTRCAIAACNRRLGSKAIHLYAHAKKGEIYVCGSKCLARYNEATR